MEIVLTKKMISSKINVMTKKELLKTLIRDFQLREIPALKPRTN